MQMGLPGSIFSLNIHYSTERGCYSAHDCWQILCSGVTGAENLLHVKTKFFSIWQMLLLQ